MRKMPLPLGWQVIGTWAGFQALLSPCARCLGRVCKKQMCLRWPQPWNMSRTVLPNKGTKASRQRTTWTEAKGYSRAWSWRICSTSYWGRKQTQNVGDLGFIGVILKQWPPISKEKKALLLKISSKRKESWNDRVAMSVAEKLFSKYQKCGKHLEPI